MILANDLKRQVRGCLSAPCMLRLSRDDDALFVTDLPRREPDGREKAAALSGAGFSVREKDGLWLIDPDDALWRAVIRQAPDEPLLIRADTPAQLAFLAVRLCRDPVPEHLQPVRPLRLLLKCIDLKQADRFAQRMPPLLAGYLRARRPLPRAAGQYLIWALNHQVFR